MKKETPEKVMLDKDEVAVIEPAIKRVMALQTEAKLVMESITPFIKLIAKNHGIDGIDYVLAPDATAFIKRPKGISHVSNKAGRLVH